MDYLENNKVKDFVKDLIIDKLDLYKNTEHYACDLAYALFEEENVNGTYHFSTYKATQWIKNNFDDLGEIVEEISSNFGDEFSKKLIVDIFQHPEGFVVVIILEVASYLLSQCKTIEDKWNDEIILDDKTIEKITKEVKEL